MNQCVILLETDRLTCSVIVMYDPRRVGPRKSLKACIFEELISIDRMAMRIMSFPTVSMDDIFPIVTDSLGKSAINKAIQGLKILPSHSTRLTDLFFPEARIYTLQATYKETKAPVNSRMKVISSTLTGFEIGVFKMLRVKNNQNSVSAEGRSISSFITEHRLEHVRPISGSGIFNSAKPLNSASKSQTVFFMNSFRDDLIHQRIENSEEFSLSKEDFFCFES